MSESERAQFLLRLAALLDCPTCRGVLELLLKEHEREGGCGAGEGT